MTGLVKATLLGVCGLVFAGSAIASVPSPGQSGQTGSAAGVYPQYLDVIGTTNGTPDPVNRASELSVFNLTVRDFGGTAIPGSNVDLNFQNCTDTKLCTAVIAGQTVDCINQTVRATTDANGRISVRVLGAATNTGAPNSSSTIAGATGACLRVFADGIQLTTVKTVDYDQNGAVGGNGLTGPDASIEKQEVLSVAGGGLYHPRSDLDHSGTIAGPDASTMKQYVLDVGLNSASGCFSGGSAQPYCP